MKEIILIRPVIYESYSDSGLTTNLTKIGNYRSLADAIFDSEESKVSYLNPVILQLIIWVQIIVSFVMYR